MFISLFSCLECPPPYDVINHQILAEHLLCEIVVLEASGQSKEALELQPLFSWYLLPRLLERAEGKSHKARGNQDTRSGNRSDGAEKDQLLSPVLSGLACAHRTFLACPIWTPATYHKIPLTHIFVFNRKNQHFVRPVTVPELICIISLSLHNNPVMWVRLFSPCHK